MSMQGPTFKLYVFPEPGEAVETLLENYPTIRDPLFVDGVPRGFIGKRYQADPAIALYGVDGLEQFLRFGSTGLADAMCVSLVSGHVVVLINVPGSRPLFVNSTISKFTQAVEAVMNRFPYYGNDADDDERDRVASELQEVIRNIDPEAVVPDRYWSTFLGDVEAGDLSTEDILSITP